MTWETFVDAMQLHARLPQLRYRVGEAQRLIRRGLRGAHRPYVSISGGKDSLVMLALILDETRDLDIVHFSSLQWEMPGTEANLQAIEARFGVRVKRLFAEDWHSEFKAYYGVYPKWDRTWYVDHWYARTVDALRDGGWDGFFVGMRSGESKTRYFALKQPVRELSGWNKGLRIAPLAAWTTEDVWAYIFANALPYHTAYALMIDAGIKVERARVDSLTNARMHNFGFHAEIKRLWPDLWNRFANENPCVLREG